MSLIKTAFGLSYLTTTCLLIYTLI